MVVRARIRLLSPRPKVNFWRRRKFQWLKCSHINKTSSFFNRVKRSTISKQVPQKSASCGLSASTSLPWTCHRTLRFQGWAKLTRKKRRNKKRQSSTRTEHVLWLSIFQRRVQPSHPQTHQMKAQRKRRRRKVVKIRRVSTNKTSYTKPFSLDYSWMIAIWTKK